MSFHLFYIIIIVSVFSLNFIIMLIAAETVLVTHVNDICFGCICEAVSGCNRTHYCSGGKCGPLRIDWIYWEDAGKLTVKDESSESKTAYTNCANDFFCAAQTLQNYMSKYSQDCNGDGHIDCMDYAAIHILGGYYCKSDLPYPYQIALEICLSLFTSKL